MTDIKEEIIGILDNLEIPKLSTLEATARIADEIIALFPTSKSYPNEYKPSTSKETVNINNWLEENKP